MCQQPSTSPAPPNPGHAQSGSSATTLASLSDARAPQLSVAINTSPVPEPIQRDLPVDQASTIGTILTQIYGRLAGGLDVVWKGPDGTGSGPEGQPSLWDPNPSNDSKYYPSGIVKPPNMADEEAWARAVSEILVGASYGQASMSNAQQNAGTTTPGKLWLDDDYYRTFGSDNPVLPIVMECQQMCTYALLTRGYTLTMLTGLVPKTKKGIIGVNAGSNKHLDPIFQNKWEPKPDCGSDPGKALARPTSKGRLTPGSLFGFSPTDEQKTAQGNSNDGVHVVFVLRVSSDKAQLLDTGAAGVGDRAPGLPAPCAMAALTPKGNYDNGLSSRALSVNTKKIPSVPFVGLGVLNPPDVDEMRKGVVKARKARPLGFARLAIFKRKNAEILYVSPLLQMHEPDDGANYPTARYLWSLREMPGCKDLQALWLLRIPITDFAGHVVTADRTDTLTKLWKPSFAQLMTSVMWLTVTDEGCAQVYRRGKVEPTPEPHTVFEPATATELKVVTDRLERQKANEDYFNPSLVGTKPDLPPYFKPW
jgi:hypothetical protein